MKWMSVFQACAAAGVLIAGVLVAAPGLADTCGPTVEDWGYQTPTGGESSCHHLGAFGSGNKDLSDAWLGANLLNNGGGTYIPLSATNTGLDTNHHVISGCTVTDTTSDGNSEAIESGCSSGVYMEWSISYDVIQ